MMTATIEETRTLGTVVAREIPASGVICSRDILKVVRSIRAGFTFCFLDLTFVSQ